MPITSNVTQTANIPGLVMSRVLGIADGGTGSSTATLTGGTGITVSGTYPNQTVTLQTPVTIPNGGTGATSAATVGGAGIAVSGTFPNETVSLQTPVTIANGGTGSTSKNFVDLSTDQTVNGFKTFVNINSTNGIIVTNPTTNGSFMQVNNTGTGGANVQFYATNTSNGGTNLLGIWDNNGSAYRATINMTNGDYRVSNSVYGANLKVGGNVGFYSTTPQSQPTVTGSRGGNAALASLLTALATLGLITDSSTA